jgi:hypothetical protein
MGLRTLTAVAAATLAFAPSALAQAPNGHAPIQGKHGRVSSTSTNWSGYDVTGTSGAIDVKGTWVQPAVVQCFSRRENSWSSPWVGIDGDTSGTVEQIGTDSDCVNGQPYYYAWYEMYPKGLVQIPLTALTVAPNHTYTAEVSTTGNGTYTLTLTDVTAGQSFTAPPQVNANAKNASVEWIMEGPSNGTLTDFGSLGFTSANATINGKTSTVQGFGNAADAITMVGKRNVTRAQPFGLSGDAFGVQWLHG